MSTATNHKSPSARVAAELRELDNIWKTRFQAAGLPQQPYRLTVDETWKRFPQYTYNVRGIPFEPEEGYIQYQSLWYRDFYMDDTGLRLQALAHNHNTLLNPSTKRKISPSDSETELPQEPARPRKKITLSEYNARSKANSAASTPAPVSFDASKDATAGDLRKELLKNAYAGKTTSTDSKVTTASSIEATQTSPPEIKIHEPQEVRDTKPATVPVQKVIDKAVEPQTLQKSSGTKRKHDDAGHDASSPSTTTNRSSKKQKTSDFSKSKSTTVDKIDTNTDDAHSQGTEKPGKQTKKTSGMPPKKTNGAVRSSQPPETARRPAVEQSMLFGIKPESNMTADLPWLTPPVGSLTPSSPDTIGPRDLSSAGNSDASVMSETFDVWDPNPATAFKAKSQSPTRTSTANKKSVDTNVVRPAEKSISKPAMSNKAPSQLNKPSPNPKSEAKPVPAIEQSKDLKPKPLVAKKSAPTESLVQATVKKEKKIVNNNAVSAAFFKQLAPVSSRTNSRPATPTISRPGTAISDIQPIAAPKTEKKARLIVKLKFGARHASEVNKLFKPAVRKSLKQAMLSSQASSPTKSQMHRPSIPLVLKATPSSVSTQKPVNMTQTPEKKKQPNNSGFSISPITTTIYRRPYE